MIEVDAISDGSGYCQFQPEALVSAIKHIVESHVTVQGSNNYSEADGAPLRHELAPDLHQAPPVGFRTL